MASIAIETPSQFRRVAVSTIGGVQSRFPSGPNCPKRQRRDRFMPMPQSDEPLHRSLRSGHKSHPSTYEEHCATKTVMPRHKFTLSFGVGKQFLGNLVRPASHNHSEQGLQFSVRETHPPSSHRGFDDESDVELSSRRERRRRRLDARLVFHRERSTSRKAEYSPA